MFYTWMKKHPEIQLEIDRVRLTILDEFTSDVMFAWGKTAATIGGRNRADRHDFLVYQGIVDDTKTVRFETAAEHEIEQLDNDALRKLAARSRHPDAIEGEYEAVDDSECEAIND